MNFQHPRPKYQIFISSTYGDLKVEREAVTWAILSARHIPVGMENFPAADDRGWKTITSAIDRSDYYVLIVAGRYGSLDKDGISWTEKEYRYAISKGIPVLAFIRDKKFISVDKTDENHDLMDKLAGFINRLSENHLYKSWSTKEELVSQVSNAIQVRILDDEESGNRRPGWFRGDEMPNINTVDEFARISSENSKLKDELQSLRELSSSVHHSQFTITDFLDAPVKESVSHENYCITDDEHLKNYDDLYRSSRWDLLALNIFCKLKLGILNNGKAIAEHVCIDLTFSHICGFFCGLNGGNLNGRDAVDFSALPAAKKERHPELIRRRGKNSISMRFRISRIPAGGIEFIPPILIFGEIENGVSIFDVDYKITGNTGSPTTGKLQREISSTKGLSLIPNSLMKASLDHLSHQFPELDFDSVFLK
jgi:hypothetical protein